VSVPSPFQCIQPSFCFCRTREGPHSEKAILTPRRWTFTPLLSPLVAFSLLFRWSKLWALLLCSVLRLNAQNSPRSVNSPIHFRSDRLIARSTTGACPVVCLPHHHLRNSYRLLVVVICTFPPHATSPQHHGLPATSRPVRRSTSRPVRRSTSRPVRRSTSRPVRRSTSRPVRRPACGPVWRTVRADGCGLGRPTLQAHLRGCQSPQG
jgi:hypothetical protein